jgi:thiol:disulfide interchange protein DsbD
MALNFLGVFEFGTGAMNWAGNSKSSGSFATGVLSVFVAAPCTGPFMGTALGAAATMSAASAMMIFLFLGFGLASPFLVLAVSPGLLKKVPKPGAWMESLKQFFAFPLFATVLWLLWVLGMQTNGEGWLIAGILLLTISFGFWLGKSRRLFWRFFAWAISIAALVFAVLQIRQAGNAPQTMMSGDANWISYDAAKIQAARQSNQSVFVDFTAAWCITCQVNKKAVLRTSAAAEIFAANRTLLVQGDWTRQDPVITKALAEFGRNSVPLYVYYPGDGSAARILPQILSMQMIRELYQPEQETTE